MSSRPRRHLGTSLLLLVVAVWPALAQCPDGTLPPCGPRLPRGPLAAPIDASTALVVPLSPIGTEPELRRLAATFSAIVAENLSVGVLKARVAEDLGNLLIEQRPGAANRRRAGAVVDGTLMKIGANVRATILLVHARTGRTLATVTVEGNADSLLALADRASVPLLAKWWGAQPASRFRGGVSTTSLRALRQYIAAMSGWGHGDRDWRSLLDSAVHADPDFVDAWAWLSVPEPPPRLATYQIDDLEDWAEEPPGSGIGGDSARSVLRRYLPRPEEMFTEGETPPVRLVYQLAGRSLERQDGELPNVLYGAPGASAEEQYLKALALRFEILVGYTDTLQLAYARRALVSDSTFIRAWQLVLSALLDIGDTAGTRRLVERRYPRDSSQARAYLFHLMRSRFADGPPPRRQAAVPIPGSDFVGAFQFNARLERGDTAGARAVVVQRFGADSARAASMAAQIASRFAEGASLTRLIAWHRFRSALAYGPDTMRGGWPALLALGMHSRVVAAAGMRLASLARRGPSVAPSYQQVMISAQLAAELPPDSQFFPWRYESVALDSAVRLFAPRASFPAARVRMEREVLARWTWLVATLAVQRGDTATARRGTVILDGLASDDTLSAVSTTLRPMAYGVAAELALAAGRRAEAETLLVRALRTSVTCTPARYRWLLASLAAETDRPAFAVRLAHSITVPTRLHPPEHALYYAQALRLEAAMLERLDRSAEALAKYREFVLLRADADPSLQAEVTEARARIAHLETVRSGPQR